MRLLLVDDNPVDRMNLRVLLGAHPGMEIVGEAENLAMAKTLVERHRPDALFLDVELGWENGFNLLQALKPVCPPIIFCTLHTRYAAEAFEVEAVDYLLKPIMPERLARALARLKSTAAVRMLALDDLIAFKSGNERRIVSVDRIATIVGDGDYSRVLVSEGKEYLDNRRLRDWQQVLPEKYFQALDRSTIVNLAEVSSFRPTGEGGELNFRNVGRSFPIGRAALRRLESWGGMQ